MGKKPPQDQKYGKETRTRRKKGGGGREPCGIDHIPPFLLFIGEKGKGNISTTGEEKAWEISGNERKRGRFPGKRKTISLTSFTEGKRYDSVAGEISRELEGKRAFSFSGVSFRRHQEEREKRCPFGKGRRGWV